MDDSLFKGRQIKVHYAIVYSSFSGYFQEWRWIDLLQWKGLFSVLFISRSTRKEQIDQVSAQRTEEEEGAEVVVLEVVSTTLIVVTCPDHVAEQCSGLCCLFQRVYESNMRMLEFSTLIACTLYTYTSVKVVLPKNTTQWLWECYHMDCSIVLKPLGKLSCSKLIIIFITLYCNTALTHNFFSFFFRGRARGAYWYSPYWWLQEIIIQPKLAAYIVFAFSFS